jgi:hypothetical protein
VAQAVGAARIATASAKRAANRVALISGGGYNVIPGAWPAL